MANRKRESGNFMKPNLDIVKAEIPEQIASRGLVMFPGYTRMLDELPIVFWNIKKSPDYQAFLDAGAAAGVKMIVFFDREFSSDLIEGALEQLEDAIDLTVEEQRGYERRLREMRAYDGFTCAVELSFEREGVIYMFELRTEWFEEFNVILDDIDVSVSPDDDDEDEGGPMGGYFSKN